ncbi:MAG: hypothetical protein HN742_25905 [Lentisphaerae bacterium]|nr:hypothetical protein [Lentisphaerota bacterium]MBT5606524.1 hypothetical protein [Lentisphaerota bacterium]MBT7845336.1 hypothetical protein [Lentisphaerota bacterium]
MTRSPGKHIFSNGGRANASGDCQVRSGAPRVVYHVVSKNDDLGLDWEIPHGVHTEFAGQEDDRLASPENQAGREATLFLR